MIAELAICNSCFAVIKAAIVNGNELVSVGQSVQSYFDSKSSIAKRADKGGSKSDMENFMALEQLKILETELREVMQWAGRANLYDDWLAFQSQAKRERDQAEKQASYKKSQHRKHMLDIFTIICTALVGIPVVGGLVYLILMFISV
tara:strand:+ start:631 stop:1071 length:441 start_codon:yes stop_codon:yes gene_type:complete